MEYRGLGRGRRRLPPPGYPFGNPIGVMGPRPLINLSPRVRPQIQIRLTLDKIIKAFSVSQDQDNVESGDKILLPLSFLHDLTILEIKFPITLRLTNMNNIIRRITHCGVLDFTVEEDDCCYLPKWMMGKLNLNQGERLRIESVSLPTATFSKFKPKSLDFYNITNPRAVLEFSLRKFTCLTTGDMITIPYNEATYDLLVVETQPSNAVSIIECDLNVEIVRDAEAEEEKKVEKDADQDEPVSSNYAGAIQPAFQVFAGAGYRLGGLPVEPSRTQGNGPVVRGIPDYDWNVGSIDFVRDMSIFAKEGSGQSTNVFVPFSGSGRTLAETQINTSKP